MPQFSRRTLFGAAGIGAVAAAAGAGVVAGKELSDDGAAPSHIVPFRGTHQAGIVTAVPDRLHYAAFDVITDDKKQLTEMLQAWTVAAERMTQGQEAAPNGATGLGEYSPPADTGEALDLSAASLTITIGFGPGLFGPSAANPNAKDRFGIGHRKPAALVDLPTFAKDAVEPSRSYGDISLQACSDDPQVAVHAIRNLARIGIGVVSVRWSQLGFGRTSSTSTSQVTPRNMFGFKDGTANLKAEDAAALAQHVWVAKDDNPAAAQWLTGGSYSVIRRIRMDIEPWDRSSLDEQETSIGRTKRDGAPLGQEGEFDKPNFQMTSNGIEVIPLTAHVRIAHPDNLGGIQILRRGYNFTDGSDGFGHLDAGLFFISYQRNPQTQFVPMQQQLARKDALMEYLTHQSTGVYAVPSGLGSGEYWGQRLLEG